MTRLSWKNLHIYPKLMQKRNVKKIKKTIFKIYTLCDVFLG